jgi:hypothetical protein
VNARKAGEKMLRVKNEDVWEQIRILFIGSAILFLANIYFGFDNALPDAISRWESLVHTHAGTLGWVTLSAVGLAIWIHSGDRDVSEAYVRSVRNFTRYGIVIFGGFIISVGLGFAGLGRIYFILMGILAVIASLYIWIAAFFAIGQLRQQPVVSTSHLLITAAMLIASIGSTMGVLLGLEYATGVFFVPGSERIGTHAGVMDTYLLLAAAAIVEFYRQKEAPQRFNRSGLFITIAWSLSMISILLGLLLDLLPAVMASVPLMLLALIVYFARGGWRAFKLNPLKSGNQGWFFFGTLWMLVWGLFFIWVAATYADDFSKVPHWVEIFFVHAAFLGMMTNFLLGVYSQRSRETSHIISWGEPIAMWVFNLGLVVFFALEIVSESKVGSVVMGIGVLLGVFTMIQRLRADKAYWKR